MLGAPLYRAPEIWLGAPSRELADLFAAALVASECCSWRLSGDALFQTSAMLMPNSCAWNGATEILNVLLDILGQPPKQYPAVRVRSAVDGWRQIRRAHKVEISKGEGSSRQSLLQLLPRLVSYAGRPSASECVDLLSAETRHP